MKRILAAGLIITSIIFSCSDRTKNQKDLTKKKEKGSLHELAQTVFEKVNSNTSGILFSNDLKENTETLHNLFDFDYFYNGAGVGVEDINQDGLLDIFFAGNQVENKLYLNEGNLRFKDITEISGINKGKIWANGVAFVDINNDKYPDIYVSQGGPNNRSNRKNLLYINNQDNTFTERAQEYGLADLGISTQSAFFDFDSDGDLDCFVMNENEFYGVDPINLYRIIDTEEKSWFNSSHLYRNDNGKFTDVTKQAGILSPIFGLGLSISDINNDGHLDIYVTSDYYIPDALYVNNGDGTFTDSIKDFTNHISYFGMGMDIADINNDTQQDIFVLDMASSDHIRAKTLMASMNTARFDYLINNASFHHQYMFNTLQLNVGGNKFNDISQLTETANTDWSWSVLMSDFDLDSDKDIYITNGYRKYALDNDLQLEVLKAKQRYGGNVPKEVKKRLYESMPSEKLPNILYENLGKLHFNENAKDWGLDDYSFSNGAAIGDLDNDGDLDIVVNNMDEQAFVYKNMSVEKEFGNYLNVKPKDNNSEPFAKVFIYYGNQSQMVETKRIRGYMSSHENSAHFGLGNEKQIDSMIVVWPNGKITKQFDVDANVTIYVDKQKANLAKVDNYSKKEKILTLVNSKKLGIDFTHRENAYDDFRTEVLLPYKQSTMGPFMSKGDVNGDMMEDLYFGGASGQSGTLYIQSSTGFTKKTSPVFEQDKHHEDMESVFFDFDGDGDSDLFVVSGGNEFETNSSLYADRLYINDGFGNFTKKDLNSLKKLPKSGKSVNVIDFDNDGDFDILVGNRVIPKKYPIHSPSTLYKNEDGNLMDVTKELSSDLEKFGIINDIAVTDFNNDGWHDFIAVGEWTGIGFFENKMGKFEKKAIGLENNDKGWWFSIKETDVNKDGLKDYVVGNVGLNIKFKTSQKKPFKIFSSDFDDNGINDIVLGKQYNGEYVPVRGRECSSQQMPFIKEKYPTYKSFAQASILDIYGDGLESSYQNEVTEFNSVVILNKGNGHFEKKILPIEAQMFPLMDIVSKDLDNDGYEDIIVAGNIFETEVETPRLDAFSGLVLFSNQKDGFTVKSLIKNSILLNGNIKDLEIIKNNKNEYLLGAANDGPITTYKIN